MICFDTKDMRNYLALDIQTIQKHSKRKTETIQNCISEKDRIITRIVMRKDNLWEIIRQLRLQAIIY